MSPSTSSTTSGQARATHEPSESQIELVGSLLASQPPDIEGYVAFGRICTTGRIWTLAELGTTASLASAVRKLRAPSGCDALGLVSRATARCVESPASPAVPVIVAYVVTRSEGSVSVLAYPDGHAVWCTSPDGALAEAVASTFQ